MTLLPVLLPDGSITKVSVGDKLTAGQVIAEKKGIKKENVIHFSHDFNISPNKIQKYLKKNLGDSIEEGTIIAVKKKIIGSQKIKSHIKGTIVRIDEEKGDIYIRTMDEEDLESILSPVDGTVDFCNNEKIVIKTQKQIIIAKDALGEERTGDLLYFEDLDSSKLTNEISDKAILTKEIDKVSFFKAIGLDAAAIITQDLTGEDFIDFEEKSIQTPVMIVSEEDFKKLVNHNKKKIYLDTKNKNIVIL